MFKYKLTGIIATLLLSTIATAELEPWIIGTGGHNGFYHKAGSNLANIIPNGNTMESKGSGENIKRLLSGEIDLAIMQLDAYAGHIAKEPGDLTKLESLSDLFPECIHIAVNKNKEVNDEDHLQNAKKDKSKPKVAIGKVGSGSFLSWVFMSRLEEGYKTSEIIPTSGSRALAKLKSSGPGGIDAFMYVVYPSKDYKYTKAIVADPELELIDVNDGDLDDEYKPLGRPIYHFQKIDLKEGMFGKVKVPCTTAVLVAGPKASEDLREAVAESLLDHRSTILNFITAD